MFSADNLDFFEDLLRYKPVYERLFQLAESKLLAAAGKGYELKHHKITSGRSSRDWNVDADVLEAHYGDAIYGAPPLLSPAQAEKQLGKSDVLAGFITKTEGGLKLAPKSSIMDEVSITASEFD